MKKLQKYSFCKNKNKLERIKYNNFRRLHYNIKKNGNHIKNINFNNRKINRFKKYSNDDNEIFDGRYNLYKNYYKCKSNNKFKLFKCNICYEKDFLPLWKCKKCKNEVCYSCILNIYKISKSNGNYYNFCCPYCRKQIKNIFNKKKINTINLYNTRINNNYNYNYNEQDNFLIRFLSSILCIVISMFIFFLTFKDIITF